MTCPHVIRAIDPELPIYNIRTLTDHVEWNLVFVRIPARMFAVLGPVLLVLSAVGVYAVVACAASQKTREIGVRLALGATAPRVVRQFVAESFQVVLLGAAAGWIAAWIIQRDVVGRPIDAFVFSAVPLILLLVAGGASWWPARRVTRVDPLVALRRE